MEFRVLCSKAPKGYPDAHRFGFVLETKGELYAAKEWVDLFFVMADSSFDGFRLLKGRIQDEKRYIVLDECLLGTRYTNEFHQMLADADTYLDSLLAKEKKEEHKG